MDAPVARIPLTWPDESGHEDAIGLASLVAMLPPLSPETSTMQAYDAFSSNSSLYALAVVDDGNRPVGILNRFKFLERLSRPFGRDLLKHQPVEQAMDRAPLVVDEGISLDDLSSALIDDATKYIFDGFIVTRAGEYLGIGTGYSLVRHLTERKQAALTHMAQHDSLTGAPNRQLFADRLSQALARARRHSGFVGLLFLDVDRLKAINDTLGHAVGDFVLRSIVTRIGSQLRAMDTVARLSGDEFAVLLPEIQSPGDAEGVATKLLGALREPHVYQDADFNVSCSIGVAVYPGDATTETALQRAADVAVYEAKHFRNTVQRYSSEIQRTHPTALLAYTSVRRALDEGRVSVWYQPQVSCATGRIVGVEALVRCHEPGRGELAPVDLIRLAEDAGLITDITQHVLATALPQVQAWKGLPGHSSLSLAVNVSGLELRDGTLVRIVEQQLDATGFPPGDLELEITETTVMLSGPHATSALAAVRELGVRLSIDDFGTGYSSLSRLQRLPVSRVKIDRTFVDGIEGDDSGTLAKAMILMAHSLTLTVTAEGVETERQLGFLVAHGCDVVQGYLIGRPMTAEACTGRLQDTNRPVAAGIQDAVNSLSI